MVAILVFKKRFIHPDIGTHGLGVSLKTKCR